MLISWSPVSVKAALTKKVLIIEFALQIIWPPGGLSQTIVFRSTAFEYLQ